jgi:hypothetical protein
VQIKDAWENFYSHSGTASSNVRKLGFTGIALVWLFSGGGIGNADQVRIDGHLEWPLYVMVIALGVDFLQYFALSIIWRAFARYSENRHGADDQFRAPDWINYIGEVFFFAKQVVVGVGYVWLLLSLADQLFA